MALLELKDIGKIYVSEGNVAVGIRGVNLSFEKGEFVAVTGKSGSGKSTLLNVISGMDTYEEGELFIEGQPTSHYLQPEWEEYRQKYISFIFQDYNIIESFTVLQNVELALMHIEDKRARRKRALELLQRVGLGDRIRQKGSKLSGGQKQRTVIARALAKDSPIILADEPTGNLDSKTSEEIIELLREVSRDKLLIVVTHNFEQVERYATRHVRVFDGAVESDHTIMPPATTELAAGTETPAKKSGERWSLVKKGCTLGRTVFTATPKLTVFICLLLVVGMLAVFALTAFCGSMMQLFEKDYMFKHIEGRVVIANRSGAPVSEDTIKKLAADYGADDYLRYDLLLDYETYRYFDVGGESEGIHFVLTYGKRYGKNILGRYPEAENEVFLYLPISQQKNFGKRTLKITTIDMWNLTWNIVGVKYFYDNTKDAEMLFGSDGFVLATDLQYLTQNARVTLTARGTVKNEDGIDKQIFLSGYPDFIPSFDLQEGKIYLDDADYFSALRQYGDELQLRIVFEAVSDIYNYYDYTSTKYTFLREFTAADITTMLPDDIRESRPGERRFFISTSLLHKITDDVLARFYRQASLFFSSDKAAHAAAKKIEAAGYLAVPSDTEYEQNMYDKIATVILNVGMLIVWLCGILFLAFVLGLCTGRSITAFKSDMAIMRSMGIPVKAVRVGIYVRMLLSLIPAYICLLITSLTIFLTPALNGYFVFLPAWQYVLICTGMLLLTLLVTRRQIRKLFHASVKKSLKGGTVA